MSASSSSYSVRGLVTEHGYIEIGCALGGAIALCFCILCRLCACCRKKPEVVVETDEDDEAA